MKETTRNLENLLTAAFRKQDCPAPEALRTILMGETKTVEHSTVLAHVRNCGYCQGEIKAMAQISGILVSAEFLGFATEDLVKIEERARKVIGALAPKELSDFPSLWQLALIHGSESRERMPLAAAAFSGASPSRATRIIHAALLLGCNPDITRLEAVAKSLRLTTKEHAALAVEFIQ